MNISIRDLVYMGITTAICIVATMILIPLPTGGMVHLGSAALFTISLIFGGTIGGVAGAFGSAIFDMVTGHTHYTIFSFFIKGIAGILVGYIAYGLRPTRHTKLATWPRIILALIVGTLWTAIGYFVAWAVVLNSVAVAVTRLPATFLTSGVGVIIAIILAPKLQKVLRPYLSEK